VLLFKHRFLGFSPRLNIALKPNTASTWRCFLGLARRIN
jgi:hypothetical protein